MSEENEKEAVSIEEFAKRYKLKINTVKKNFHLIKGAYIKENEYIIFDSCRYPYFKKHLNIKTRDDKKYVILRATYEYKYVDRFTVGMSQSSFKTMVNELKEKGYLIENGSGDTNGLNAYDVSDEVGQIIYEKKHKKHIIDSLFIRAGMFTGACSATYHNLAT